MQIDLNIEFTPQEREAISIIKEVMEKYAPSVQVYIVGGLIRDRLVGLESHDLDIMVYPIKAEEFARLITKYLNIKDPHVIKDNPEKSKFISTSKIYLPTQYGLQEIDIAQARQDVYKEDSRIPQTTTATPEQDAYRRDLTVNSLMYSLNDNKIVDFTGMGIKDLISKTIRTPQDPLKTFSEDPLRIFRTVVYAAKLNGNIDPQTYEAMKNPELRNEIKNKVSKERVGQEILKILKNPNPDYALRLLKDTGLFDDIISEALKGTKYEGKMANLDMEQGNVHHKLNLFEHSMQTVKNVLDKYPNTDAEKRITMILAALMHDLGKLFIDIHGESKSHPGNKSYHGHEDESKQISELILKYLKIEPLIKEVSGLVEHHMRAHSFIEQGQGGARALRKFLRTMGEQSLNWLDVFNLSMSDALSKDVEIDPVTVKQYQELEQRLQEALLSLSPTKDTTIKPILNGNEIMQLLNIKPGKWMSTIMDFVKELKDDNPNIDKEEAAKLVKDKFQNIDIKQASKEKEKKINTICPIHLLHKKIAEINKLFKEHKYYEVLTTINDLKENYGEDESVVRLLAIATFNVLIKSEEYRNNDLIQHILDKAEKNFFDSTLCAYIVGILILIPTTTEKDIIKEVASRVLKMQPDTLKKVINMLPEQVYNEKIRKELTHEDN